MNWQQISGNPFFTVALPLMVTALMALLFQNSRFTDLGKRLDDLRSDMNKRFDGVDKRFDAVDRRLEKIEAKLDDHSGRISKLEGPPLVRQ